jgi:hypothetical protein
MFHFLERPIRRRRLFDQSQQRIHVHLFRINAEELLTEPGQAPLPGEVSNASGALREPAPVLSGVLSQSQPLLAGNSNDQFAKVPAFEQSNEGGRSVRKTFNDVFTKLHFSVPNPLAHLSLKLLESASIVIENNEALECEAFG